MSVRSRVAVAVIGAGQAGPPLAVAFAQAGEQVLLFEADRMGGTCVNTGCTPTKTLRKSARVAHLARRAADFGVQVGPVTVNFAAAIDRMDRVVGASRDGLTGWVQSTPGVTVVNTRARLDGREGDAFVVRAGDATYVADRVYLNVGTRASLPPIDGLEAVEPLLNDTLLALRTLPAHLVIVGGSYIGVEMGQIFRRLGSDVTIIESGPAIVSREDADVSAKLTASLAQEGIHIVTNANVQAVSGRSGTDVTVRGTVGDDSRPFAVHGSHLLVATGRTPNTDQLGLETVGVTRDARGYVPVDGALRTNIDGIWAVGDVNRRGAFTHTSWQDHEIVLANHRGQPRSVDGRVMTYALYTDPPIGRVGMNLRDAGRAKSQGRRFLHVTHDMANVGRAKEESETTGLIRLLVDADTRRFTGATIFGIGGDEIVQLIGAMMAADAPYDVVRDFLPIHPTVTEFLPTVLGRLETLE